MITQRENKCEPQKLRQGEIPDYICFPDGRTHYLSREEKKDYQYGGKCPEICPIRNNRGDCPNVDYVSDTTVARNTCQSNPNCQFIGNQVFDRNGPNYCVPKTAPPGRDCIVLTEADYAKGDKALTDSPNVCDRLNKGCIFNRGNADPKIGRNADPTCLRGCLGSKYWNNPKYLWGGGGTLQDPFRGSFFNSDLQLGPIYLEASPSDKNPTGWGGPVGAPYFGNGLLPRSMGIPYTESRGQYSPPCNINEGDIGAFTTAATGEDLAGPGCRLTAPMPQYGLHDWSYTCSCPYANELKVDAYAPCQDWELNQENIQDRDICRGCYIEPNKKSDLYGHCVLGTDTPDTESRLLGCFEDPSNPDKCRVKRIVPNTDCPHFCSEDPFDPLKWKAATQCSQQFADGCWKLNPKYNKVISKLTKDTTKIAPPFIPGSALGDAKCRPKDTDYLCQNCAQTSVKSIGSATLYPNRSYCLVGGSTSSDTIQGMEFSNDLARKLSCPATCSGCHSGFFNEPMLPVYKLNEASNPSSAFNKGILFVPWVGTQAQKELRTESKNFGK